ncbi:MAG: hypothetical protein U0520_02080 [Candidatus Saccharimonadales bacterium]
MNNVYFPLKVEFKKIALTNKMTVTDANGTVVAFAHQKLLKLKEQILLYADTNKTQPIGEIRADRVIDFSPLFVYQDQSGSIQLAIKRNGRRSILKADYDILNAAQQPVYKVREDNGWIKFFDAIVGELPIIGIFTGYFLNPKYNVTNLQGELVARFIKRPSLLESSYEIEVSNTADQNIGLLPIASLAVLSRERLRG